MTEATRSMLEWIASVMIATEPVIAPATSLSTISAGWRRSRARRRGRAARSTASSRAARPAQRAGRAAAVRDRVLLGVGELGHRAAVGAVVGHEHRVVAEAAVAARLGGQRPVAAALERALGAVGRRRGRSRRRSAAREPARRLARASFARFSPSVASSPA